MIATCRRVTLVAPGSDERKARKALDSQAIDAEFASDETPADLRAGFDVLAETIGDDDRGSATETFWAALHGIHLLERARRMRPENRAARVAELNSRFSKR